MRQPFSIGSFLRGAIGAFIVEVVCPIATDEEPGCGALQPMTTRALRDLARGKIKGFMKLSKAELISALAELPGS